MIRADLASAGASPSEFLRRRESVEQRIGTNVLDDRHEDIGERFLCCSALQRPSVHPLHPHITAELLHRRSSTFIADPEVAWPGPGGGGLIEPPADVDVERLRRGPPVMLVRKLADAE